VQVTQQQQPLLLQPLTLTGKQQMTASLAALLVQLL
jgi:hypothetical protein